MGLILIALFILFILPKSNRSLSYPNRKADREILPKCVQIGDPIVFSKDTKITTMSLQELTKFLKDKK